MTTTPGVGGAQDKGDKPSSIADAAGAALKRVFDQFSYSVLRETDKAISSADLGPLAKQVYDGLQKRFETSPQVKGHVVSEVIVAAYQQLKQAYAQDLLAAFDPGAAPRVQKQSQSQIPQTEFIAKSGDNKFKLAGTVGPDHVLFALLKAAGINPESFSEKISKLLEGARTAHEGEGADRVSLADLSNDKAYKALGRQLRKAATDEGIGAPNPEQVARNVAAADAAIARNRPSRVDPNFGPVPGADLGLEKTAAGKSNTGSASNATAIRAQLLTGIKSQGQAIDKTAGELAEALIKDLKGEKVTAEQKAEITSAIKEILTDPRSPDGSVSPSTVLVNAFEALDKRLKDGEGKTSAKLGIQFAEILRATGAEKKVGIERAISDMAVATMGDVAAAILGKDTAKPTDRTVNRMWHVLESLGKDTSKHGVKEKGNSLAAGGAKAYQDQVPKVERMPRAKIDKVEVERQQKIDEAIAALPQGSIEHAPKETDRLDKVAVDIAVAAMRDGHPVFARVGKGLLVANPEDKGDLEAVLNRYQAAWDPDFGKTAEMRGQAPGQTDGTKDATDAKGAKGATDTKGPDAAKAPKGAKNDPAVLAKQLLEELGINTDHPKIKPLEEALTEILAKGADPTTVSLNAFAYLGDHAGVPQSLVDNTKQVISAMSDDLKATKDSLKQIRESLARAETSKKGMQDPGAIADIDRAIAGFQSSIQQQEEHKQKLVDSLLDARDKGLTGVAEWVLEPDNFRKKYELDKLDEHGNPKDPNGPNGKGPDGAGGGGDDDPPSGKRNLFARGPAGTPRGIPGLFRPGSPTDEEDPAKFTLQQERAAKCASILADPSLCIEDKIFLFMMWFVSFTDREREEKMSEIVELDNRDARRAEQRDKAYREQQSQKQMRVECETALKQAEQERTQIKGQTSDPTKVQAADQKVEVCKQRLGECKDRIGELTEKYNALKRESDRSPQSRELKFMELRRLDDLRDKIINMVRAMMDVSNRNTEKIFR